MPTAHTSSSPHRVAASSKPIFSLTVRTVLLILLFASALGIRLYRITDAPLAFHATRQYRSALLARGYYYELLDSVPEPRKRVATVAKDRMGILEPPVSELVASVAYWLSGGERLWIPNLLSSLYWMAGGVFLFLLVAYLASADAALISTVFYLFLPYGVEASRSFQPDPLMVMLFMGSVHFVVRYFDQPSGRRLGAAVVCSAMAIFIKPVCLFPIFGAFAAAAFATHGLRGSVVRRAHWIFIVASLMPTAVYYTYGLFIGQFLKTQAQMSFMPSLLLKSDFWNGWLMLISHVLGYTMLLLALLGGVMFRSGLPRALVIGLWIGYFLYGLIFTYHIHTHDYYHLPLIPIVALSLAPVVDSIFERLGRLLPGRGSGLLATGAIIAGLLLSAHQGPWRRPRPDPEPIREMMRSVGQVVNHSANTVLLAHSRGKPLQFYGAIAGINWPDSNELWAKKLRGKPELAAEERLRRMMDKHSLEYFIVTNLRDFFQQEDLKALLTRRFPLITRTDHYWVFDLRTDRKSLD